MRAFGCRLVYEVPNGNRHDNLFAAPLSLVEKKDSIK